MQALITVVIIVVFVLLILAAASARLVKQYEDGVLFRLGKVIGDRLVVGQHTLDETLVELKDIQLPESMKRAMARQAEAEREKRAKIISAEGESMAAAAQGVAGLQPPPPVHANGRPDLAKS